MKVPLSSKVKLENYQKVEETSLKWERTISETLDRILDDYFFLEKNNEKVA